MLRHQLGQDLVLLPNLLLQLLAAYVILTALRPPVALQGKGRILEQLLLSAVKYAQRQGRLVADRGDRDLLNKMSA